MFQFFFVQSIFECFEDDLDCKVGNLHSTDDGEASEESHGSTNSWQYVYKLSCPVLGDSVKGCCIKVNPYKSQTQPRIKFFKCIKVNFENNESCCLPLNFLESTLYIFLNFL